MRPELTPLSRKRSLVTSSWGLASSLLGSSGSSDSSKGLVPQWSHYWWGRKEESRILPLTSWLLYLFYSEWNTLLGRRPVRISHWGLFQSRCLHYLMVIIVVDAWPRCCFSPGLLIRQRRAFFFVETSLVFDFQLWSLIFIGDWFFFHSKFGKYVWKENPENVSVCHDIVTEIHNWLTSLYLVGTSLLLLYLRNKIKLCLMHT